MKSPTDTAQAVITTFETMPGQCQDLIDALQALFDGFIRHQQGFVSVRIHVNDAHTRVANYALWRRREDFLAMLRAPEMREPQRRLAALCKSFEPVIYEVVGEV